MMLVTRPAPTEFAPYYSRYIDLVPEGDILERLRVGGEETRRLLEPLSEAAGSVRYDPAKWSVKQVVAHMSDSERVFTYRALRFARRDETPLPGFDQDTWVAKGRFDERSLASLVAELRTVRTATLALFENLDAEAWDLLGTANEVRMSVRAAAFVIAGHELHHRNVLRERYRIG